MTSFAIVRYSGTHPDGRRAEVDLEQLSDLLLQRHILANKLDGPGFSPTRYLAEYTYHRANKKTGEIAAIHVTAPAVHRCNEGVQALSCLVLDIDHHAPDWPHLIDLGWLILAYTTHSHTYADPHWRLVLPLHHEVLAADWPRFFHSAVQLLDPRADTSCGDASRFFYTHATPSDVDMDAATRELGGRLLDPVDVPLLHTSASATVTLVAQPKRCPSDFECFRAGRLLEASCKRLAEHTSGGRQVAAYGYAHSLGHWVAAQALDEDAVYAALWAACETNEVATERPAETERAIRLGLAKGMTLAVDFDAPDDRAVQTVSVARPVGQRVTPTRPVGQRVAASRPVGQTLLAPTLTADARRTLAELGDAELVGLAAELRAELATGCAGPWTHLAHKTVEAELLDRWLPDDGP